MKNNTQELKNKLRTAFAILRKNGYIARMNFLCCQSCAGYALSEKAHELAERGKEIKGVVFYHKQDEENLQRSGECFLAFGDITHDDKKYGLSTKQVGKIASIILEEVGLQVDWDGTENTRIKVSLPEIAA